MSASFAGTPQFVVKAPEIWQPLRLPSGTKTTNPAFRKIAINIFSFSSPDMRKTRYNEMWVSYLQEYRAVGGDTRSVTVKDKFSVEHSTYAQRGISGKVLQFL